MNNAMITQLKHINATLTQDNDHVFKRLPINYSRILFFIVRHSFEQILCCDYHRKVEDNYQHETWNKLHILNSILFIMLRVHCQTFVYVCVAIAIEIARVHVIMLTQTYIREKKRERACLYAYT